MITYANYLKYIARLRLLHIKKKYIVHFDSFFLFVFLGSHEKNCNNFQKRGEKE